MSEPPDTRAQMAVTSDVARGLIDAAPDGVVIVDDEGRILLVNRHTEAMFGYSRRHALVGEQVEILVPVESVDAHRELREDYGAAPRTRPMGMGLVLHGRRSDGALFPVEISLSPYRDADERPLVIAAIRDVTEREEIQEELAAARLRALISEDRDRVARDLHDTIIQELFATGMHLQAAAGTIGEPDAARRVSDAVDSIDLVIRHIRNTIFGLTSASDAPASARHQIERLLESCAVALGFVPSLTVPADIDDTDATLVEHLLPTLSEALTNAARHADASVVDVTIGYEEDAFTLRVVDDGGGFDEDPTHVSSGRGLANMRDRAAALGGTFEVVSSANDGTVITWRVPLPET